MKIFYHRERFMYSKVRTFLGCLLRIKEGLYEDMLSSEHFISERDEDEFNLLVLEIRFDMPVLKRSMNLSMYREDMWS
jgi:hypothetical protein